MRRNDSNESDWGIPMTLGVLMILCGGFAMFTAVVTSVVSAIFIGTLLLAVGALQIVTAFRVRREGAWLTFLLAGLLAAVIGALFVFRPLAGVATLTLLIASYLFASGLFCAVTAIADRYRGWGWDLAYGLFAVMLGGYVSASWPISALWVLGTVVGAEIVGRGVALVAASWTLRDLEHGARTPV